MMVGESTYGQTQFAHRVGSHKSVVVAGRRLRPPSLDTAHQFTLSVPGISHRSSEPLAGAPTARELIAAFDPFARRAAQLPSNLASRI